jgi:hypothetical protein
MGTQIFYAPAVDMTQREFTQVDTCTFHNGGKVIINAGNYGYF